MEWFKTTEKLPERAKYMKSCSDNMICLFDGGSIYICFYDTRDKIWYDYARMEKIETPTHWMRLPELPKKD